MRAQLLKHIQALSNSNLLQINALETFARCFNSIYGNCAFISLAATPVAGRIQVRLVFRTDAQQTTHFNNFIDAEHFLDTPELLKIITQDQPLICPQIEDSLADALQVYELPTQGMMVLPIYLDGVIARWVLVLGTRTDQFSEVNLEQAVLLANLAGSYMARIDETEALRQANSWIQKELDDIARIQHLLLPQDQVPITGTQYAVMFESCDQAGGDYFDIVNLSKIYAHGHAPDEPDVWGAIVADASGHGAASAVEVAMFDAILRTYRGSEAAGPAEVFNYTNHYYFTRKLRGSFITATIMRYDPQEARLTYANAGHPPIIMQLPDGELQFLDAKASIPLGVQQDWQWQNVTLDVKSRTRLIVYTDGIIEALSPSHEQFGLTQLISIIEQNKGSVEDLVAQVRSALQRHQAGLPQNDDQAFLVFEIQ